MPVEIPDAKTRSKNWPRQGKSSKNPAAKAAMVWHPAVKTATPARPATTTATANAAGSAADIVLVPLHIQAPFSSGSFCSIFRFLNLFSRGFPTPLLFCPT